MDSHILLVVGMAVATYVSRGLPLLLLSSKPLPKPFLRWLEMIPPAVLSALLASELFLKSEAGSKVLFISSDNVVLLASFPTALFGWYTKNFFGSILVGMISVALLRHFWM